MIYINTVVTNKPMCEMKNISRDFEFFETRKPQRFSYPKNEEEEMKIKKYQMFIVIAGTMFGDLKRNNENLVSRTLLFIDFDDVHDTEEVFLKKITEKLDDVNYCLYPTLKYKPDNIRYRLVLELDRPVNAEEYEKLLFGISREVGVAFNFDESNKTWSQGQGLPVITEYSNNEMKIFHDGFKKIPVDSFIFKINQSNEWKQEKKKRKINTGTIKLSDLSSKRKYTGILLEELFEGTSVGNRNTWWRTMVDKMLSVDTPIETIAKVMDTINFNGDIFPDPLDQKELETIFRSRIENHAKGGGNLY